MRVDFNAPIKAPGGKEYEDGSIIPAEQFAIIIQLDRGGSVSSAREAYKLNDLIGRIACAEEPIDVSDGEVAMLRKVLESAIKDQQASTYLVGELYRLLGGALEE